MKEKKSPLERFSVTIEQKLLARFDTYIVGKGYATRSEAVRDLVRDTLVQENCANPNAEAAGVVVLVYNHHERQLSGKLTDEQHKVFHSIISAMHVHMDHDNCMEIIALRGKAEEIKKVADSLICMKGVRHGKYIETSAET
ncbi:MAG: nickel-responsive transcriptional regulator NikR [Spirochaetaceae bacterium]|nr:MAG: nickel-responsive transcriptional regulator NikR [Spirochaetaceae bacterium]